MSSQQTGNRDRTQYGSIALAVAAVMLLLIPGVSQNRKHSTPPRQETVQPPPARSDRQSAKPPVGRATSNNNREASPNRTNSSASRTLTANKTSHRNDQPIHLANRAAVDRTVPLKSGGIARLNAQGRVRSIDRNGIHIEYAGRGTRTTFGVRDGARVVTIGLHQGYVERPYVMHNGHAYVQRTYVINHTARAAAFRTYNYHGVHYYGYAASSYYRPVFYRWAYNPWPTPVYWSWGWTPSANPWYGYYGYYFEPDHAYGSAALWLTDYLVAGDLQAAYDAGAANTNNVDSTGTPPPSLLSYSEASAGQHPMALSPAVKQAITEEVKVELVGEQSAASQNQDSGGAIEQAAISDDEVPPALDPGFRTFVVATSLDVVSTDQECTLTPGDVITRLTNTPDQNQEVTASVSSSKKADCAPGKSILVSVQDLQEMQNHFREQLDSGLKELAARSGTGGLPVAPDAALVSGEIPPPVVDATAAEALQEQEQAADQTEKEVAVEASRQGPS